MPTNQMAAQLFALITVLSLNTIESRRRFLGGSDVPPGQLPFVVRIENFDLDIQEQLHCCTGTLVRPQWVLTAAHCDICWNAYFMRIRYGHVDARWNASNTYSNYTKIFVNPGYRADPYRLQQGEKLTQELLRHFVYQNDIALIQIEPIHTIPVAKISNIEYNTAIGKLVKAAGYGIMSAGFSVDNTLALSLPLQYAMLMIKDCDPTLVINSYPIICVSHKCEKGDYGETVMPGDSGGPLLLNDSIIGVCSYGFHALHGQFMVLKESGFYTAVGPYLDWIENVIGDNEM